jgi:hypothetical protein
MPPERRLAVQVPVDGLQIGVAPPHDGSLTHSPVASQRSGVVPLQRRVSGEHVTQVPSRQNAVAPLQGVAGSSTPPGPQKYGSPPMQARSPVVHGPAPAEPPAELPPVALPPSPPLLLPPVDEPALP